MLFLTFTGVYFKIHINIIQYFLIKLKILPRKCAINAIHLIFFTTERVLNNNNDKSFFISDLQLLCQMTKILLFLFAFMYKK